MKTHDKIKGTEIILSTVSFLEPSGAVAVGRKNKQKTKINTKKKEIKIMFFYIFISFFFFVVFIFIFFFLIFHLFFLSPISFGRCSTTLLANRNRKEK